MGNCCSCESLAEKKAKFETKYEGPFDLESESDDGILMQYDASLKEAEEGLAKAQTIETHDEL